MFIYEDTISDNSEQNTYYYPLLLECTDKFLAVENYIAYFNHSPSHYG